MTTLVKNRNVLVKDADNNTCVRYNQQDKPRIKTNQYKLAMKTLRQELRITFLTTRTV